MSKKGKLDNIFMRLVVLAAVLFVVVYYMLDKKFGTPPELENAEKYTIFLKPTERGMDRASLAPASMDSVETDEGLNAPLVRLGLNRLTKSLKKTLRPKWTEKKGSMDNYLWYHAAQVAFLVGQAPWEQWNNMLKDLLIENQIKDGPRKGAWEDSYFKWGDRSEIYATALNIMILETYYRYYR